MKEVTLLYFAGVRDLLGRAEERASLPDDVRTIADVRAWLVRERPALADRMEWVRLARNERFAVDEDAIASGDVIALIPPVAGG